MAGKTCLGTENIGTGLRIQTQSQSKSKSKCEV